MTNRKPSARTAALGLLSLLGFLTAGCVNLPANSGVNAVSKQTDAAGGSDVRIWPKGPQRNEDPQAIVEGFLQTAASDPGNLSIARQYLTGDAQWDPQKVVVFSGDESSPAQVPGHGDQVRISGTVLANVGDDGTYEPVSPVSAAASRSGYLFVVKFNEGKGYYQIDQLPDEFGIALTEETFRAEYNAYDLYYLNSAAPGESMIPVPVYMRGQSDVVVAQKLADKLLAGPPGWLSGVAVTAAPQIALASLTNAVSIGSDGTAQVTVKTPNVCTTHGHSACNGLADELLATYSDLASVSHVTIVDQRGAQLGASSGTVDYVMRRYHVGLGGPGDATYYFLGKDNHAVYYSDSKGSRLEQVGPPGRRYSRLAVTNYDGATIAATVDDSGTKLYLGAPGDASDRQPVYTGSQLVSLSWDALGHLWFIDKSQHSAALYRLDVTQGLQARPQQVTAFGPDGDPPPIAQLAVAPDGRRVAVVYSEQSSTGSTVYSVGLGVLQGSGSSQSLDLRQAIENPVVDQWDTVQDIDWHGSESLAVLGGQQPSSPSVVSELYTDGSPVTNSTDLNAVTINPPNNTGGIEWAGSTLLAVYGGTGGTAPQITQYSFNSNSWSSQGSAPVQGFSPSYAY